MKLDIDAKFAAAPKWWDAAARAQAAKPEEAEIAGLMPMFVPAALCTSAWRGPIVRLSNPDVALTWCILPKGDVLTCLTHEQAAYWESQEINWMAQAYRNLVEDALKKRTAKLLNNKGGRLIAIKLESADGLGSSRLLMRDHLAGLFPQGYRVALPDRNFGVAFAADLVEEDVRTVRYLIDSCLKNGLYPLVSATYAADEMLPEHPTERSRLLQSQKRQSKLVTALKALLEPYRRGDYEAALQSTEQLRQNGQITAPYCFYRGILLVHLDRIQEAEDWLRRTVDIREAEGAKRHLSIALTMLGELMAQTGRFSEAQECFERSVAEDPERGSGYRHLALVCLLRGDSLDRAVTLIRQAIKKDETASVVSAELQNSQRGVNLAALAWVVAAKSRDAAEVARLAGDAVSVVSECSVETRSWVQYHLGRAYAALDDWQTAASHFEEAARIDVQGHWGRRARAELA